MRNTQAAIAQTVEQSLASARAAGSNPARRSKLDPFDRPECLSDPTFRRMTARERTDRDCPYGPALPPSSGLRPSRLPHSSGLYFDAAELGALPLDFDPYGTLEGAAA